MNAIEEVERLTEISTTYDVFVFSHHGLTMLCDKLLAKVYRTTVNRYEEFNQAGKDVELLKEYLQDIISVATKRLQEKINSTLLS